MNGNPTTAQPSQKIVDFNKELQALLDKYQYDIGAVTWITPDGRIAAKPEVFDRTPAPADPNAKPVNNGVKLTPTEKQPEGLDKAKN